MRYANHLNPICMQTRACQLLCTCLLMLAPFCMSAKAQSPEFPPDPGNLYIPSVIVIMGDTVEAPADQGTEIDVLGDSSIVYDTEMNILTLNAVDLAVGDSTTTAIGYEGTDPLIIVLKDSSSILADTVIVSQSDVVITGDGMLVAEGVVPIKGTRHSTITFDSVNMHVRSLPSAQALRRRIKYGKHLDETGGPALSGFGSADFNKTNVSPEDAEYGPLPCTGDNCGGDDEQSENVLYTINENGEAEVVTEFDLTTEVYDGISVQDTRLSRALDLSLPMYNILGLPVDAGYRGLVIQQGQTYLLR